MDLKAEFCKAFGTQLIIASTTATVVMSGYLTAKFMRKLYGPLNLND